MNHVLVVDDEAEIRSSLEEILNEEGYAVATAATAANQVTPVATVKQIMIGITNPGAYVVYEAVGTKNTAKGIEEIAPQTDEDWAKVESAAAAVVVALSVMP